MLKDANKLVQTTVLAASGLALGVALEWYKLAEPSKNREVTLQNQVPTLFIHGYAGTRLSSGLMIKRFEHYGWGQKSTVIVVKADGRLKIKGCLLYTSDAADEY